MLTEVNGSLIFMQLKLQLLCVFINFLKLYEYDSDSNIKKINRVIQFFYVQLHQIFKYVFMIHFHISVGVE